MTYFKLNNLFTSSQYGFIPGRSAVIQLLKLVDKWTAQLEAGGQIDVIILTLKRLSIRFHTRD